MQFEFNASRRIQPERILAAIRTLSKELARSPRRTDFDRWPARPCTSTAVVARFGSWTHALSRAGLRPAPRILRSPEELIAALESVWKSLGRPPGDILLAHRTGISRSPYIRHWGGVTQACEALAAFRRRRITRDQLLAGHPRSRPRPSLTIPARWRILQRDRYRCVLCGKSPANDHSIKLEVDHIKPVCAGGSDGEDNLRTLCRTCHAAKSFLGADRASRRKRAASRRRRARAAVPRSSRALTGAGRGAARRASARGGRPRAPGGH